MKSENPSSLLNNPCIGGLFSGTFLTDFQSLLLPLEILLIFDDQNKSVATLVELMTINLNVSKQAGSNSVRSMYISFIHQSNYSNKINLLLYSAATNMQWINLKALTSEAITLL